MKKLILPLIGLGIVASAFLAQAPTPVPPGISARATPEPTPILMPTPFRDDLIASK